jgi:hypothetical protein
MSVIVTHATSTAGAFVSNAARRAHTRAVFAQNDTRGIVSAVTKCFAPAQAVASRFSHHDVTLSIAHGLAECAHATLLSLRKKVRDAPAAARGKLPRDRHRARQPLCGAPALGPLSGKRFIVARMPIPQPWFRTPEDYEAIRHLVTDEPQLFDTFEEWLDAADKRFEKFIAKGITVKKVFVDPQEFTAWCSATNVGPNRASFLAFVIATSTKQ